jgi:hypothetical protein
MPGQQHGGGQHAGDVRFPPAAQVMSDPVRGDQTSSGLPMRVPQANLLPGSFDGAPGDNAPRNGGRDGGRREETPQGYGAQGYEGRSSAQGWPQERSPEIARSRLSGFQRGVRRGKSQTPGAGEGFNR